MAYTDVVLTKCFLQYIIIKVSWFVADLHQFSSFNVKVDGLWENKCQLI